MSKFKWYLEHIMQRFSSLDKFLVLEKVKEMTNRKMDGLHKSSDRYTTGKLKKDQTGDR